MKRKLARWSRVAGIALLVIGMLAIVRWHPAWAVWVAIGFVGLNVLLVVGLAIGWTVLLRRERRKQAEQTDGDAEIE